MFHTVVKAFVTKVMKKVMKGKYKINKQKHIRFINVILSKSVSYPLLSMRIILLLFLFSNISMWNIKAQDLCFINYSTHNGLPSSQVYNIFQDTNGDIWFASDRGITNFDGNKFTSHGVVDGISNYTTFKFYPQKNGEIWCSTIDNSLYFFR